MSTQITVKVIEAFHLLKAPNSDVGVGRVAAIKLSQAAIVALGQIQSSSRSSVGEGGFILSRYDIVNEHGGCLANERSM